LTLTLISLYLPAAMLSQPIYANATRAQLKGLLVEYANATYYDQVTRVNAPLLPLLEKNKFERGQPDAYQNTMLHEMQGQQRVSLSPDALFFADYTSLFMLYYEVRQTGEWLHWQADYLLQKTHACPR
jgi:hypothetical protein